MSGNPVQNSWIAPTLAILFGLALPPGWGALSWTSHPGFRAAPVAPGSPGRTGFTLLRPEQTGILFTNLLPPSRHYTNQILINGSGVAAGDLDGDGWCDLVFCGLTGRSALYRNRGNWQFEDVTGRSGLALSNLDATGVAAADLDGDDDLDLVINTVGQGTFCFENRGQGRFAPSQAAPVLNPGRCGSSLALADLDGDGRLDLYIANYRVSTMRDEPHNRFTINWSQGEPRVSAFGNRPITDPDLANRFVFRYQMRPGGGGTVFHDEQGEPDALYRNLGGGRLSPILFTNGQFLDETGAPLSHPPYDWGLSVMLRDLNGDHAPDIYLCNDFTTPDRIWINDGAGRFRPLPTPALRQTSLSTMAMDIADINRDGWDDIFTADMLSREHWRRLVQKNEPNPNMQLFVDVVHRPQFPRNMLQLNRGDGTYAEVAQMAGLEASEWTWTPIFLDVDLDGYEDLLVVNGFERDYMNMDANRRVREMQARAGRQLSASEQLGLSRLYPRLATPNLAFRNLGNLRFTETGAEWGFDLAAISQGMCLADLDNDGDLDAAINNLNAPAALLRNETAAPRLAVRLKGLPPNTRGIGARLKITGGPVPFQTQEMICGGRYLSSDEAIRVFAAGGLTNRLAAEVTWRNGSRTLLSNLPPNHICEIAEAGATSPPSAPPTRPEHDAPLFRDVSYLLGYSHQQTPCDDFAAQSLLPAKLTTLGPGLSWLDLDGDGATDLALPGGRGSTMALLHNDGRGGFARLGGRSIDQTLDQSQTALLGWRTPRGMVVLVAGISRDPEPGSTNGPPARQYNLAADQVAEPFPSTPSATGPLALADVDCDGDLDLFVGGRYLPGRWPEPASSTLFSQKDGQWSPDARNAALFQQAGLVSAALFSDLDRDGDPDLLLACEWGPIRAFANHQGQFASWDWKVVFSPGTPAPHNVSTLSQLTGWWNGLSAADFDGDGRLDLAASNWGRNTKYERFRSRPLQVYFGDFIGDDSVGIVESWFDPGLQKYTPVLNIWTMSRSLPWLLTRFNSYEAFSRVSVEEALGQYFPRARHWEAAWLDSIVLLNRGDYFEVRSLPIQAQMAPAFAACAADFNGDGCEDLFLSQNFFDVRPDTSRYDAGRGLLLRGDGKGGFTALPGQESGLRIYGQQRGAAVCDYDNDGRVDLAVAQVGDQTKLYHNETARPGLRVVLRGGPGNPQAVGALLRLKSGQGWGPVREIRAGSGYWSQDSAVQVMTLPDPPTHLRVRWPTGKTVEVDIPAGAPELSVSE